MKTISECSIDTKALVSFLLAAQPDEIVTNERMSREIGRNVASGARHILQSARHILQRDHGVVFDAVPTVGLKRLTSAEVVTVCRVHGVAKIRRQARRVFRKVTAIRDFDSLPNDKKIEHNMVASTAGMIAHVARESSLKKLEGKIDASGALPIGKTLEAFKG